MSQSKDSISRINILGGEPTLHPDIGEIIDSLRKITNTIVIMTNLSA